MWEQGYFVGVVKGCQVKKDEVNGCQVMGKVKGVRSRVRSRVISRVIGRSRLRVNGYGLDCQVKGELHN